MKSKSSTPMIALKGLRHWRDFEMLYRLQTQIVMNEPMNQRRTKTFDWSFGLSCGLIVLSFAYIVFLIAYDVIECEVFFLTRKKLSLVSQHR